MRSAPTCLLAAVTALAASAAFAQDPPPLRVFAAASLTEVVLEIARSYEAVRVEPSFGGSSALARQIRDGAPADVFLSASPDWVDYLREADALAGEPIVLARNDLVCIASRKSPLAGRSVPDARALLTALGADGRVAIADEGVPGGEYARTALRRLGLLAGFRPHLVGVRDVRAVLHAVEQGELPAGFVYATDARLAAVETLFVFDPATHPRVEYRAAIVRDAHDADEARRFVDHLQGEMGRTLLRRAGFSLPEPS